MADYAINKGTTTVCLNSAVESLIIEKGKVRGVKVNGVEVKSKHVVTNCDMNMTYFKLLSEEQRKQNLDEATIKGFQQIDYTSPVMKINLAVSCLPKFRCLKSMVSGDFESRKYQKEIATNILTGTIHIGCESMTAMDEALKEAQNGHPSSKPVIEMTIPSIVDKTLMPEGTNHHVIGLFIQYVPYKLSDGKQWNEETKREYANIVYKYLDEYCEGFTDSILFDDILSPLDLEQEFSLTGGNIFHGVMDLNSIFFCRPAKTLCEYKQPIDGLWSCSSAMHPGGGIMGAPGRNCAMNLLSKF